jgi:hypothetical protein
MRRAGCAITGIDAPLVLVDMLEELVVSFPGYGLYYFDETDGSQLLNAAVPEEMKPINFYP